MVAVRRWRVDDRQRFVQFREISALDPGLYTVRVDRPANAIVDNYTLSLVPDFAGNGPLTGLNLGTLSNMSA